MDAREVANPSFRCSSPASLRLVRSRNERRVSGLSIWRRDASTGANPVPLDTEGPIDARADVRPCSCRASVTRFARLSAPRAPRVGTAPMANAATGNFEGIDATGRA